MTDEDSSDFDFDDADVRRVPSHAGGGRVYDGRWLADRGIGEDGEPGCSVTDMRPDRGDASEVQFVFGHHPAMGVLKLVTVHRHGMEGECEQVPADHYTDAAGVPDAAVEIASRLLDCPIAVPGREG